MIYRLDLHAQFLLVDAKYTDPRRTSWITYAPGGNLLRGEHKLSSVVLLVVLNRLLV